MHARIPTVREIVTAAATVNVPAIATAIAQAAVPTTVTAPAIATARSIRLPAPEVAVILRTATFRRATDAAACKISGNHQVMQTGADNICPCL
jgi:hypothetical protein